MTAPSSSTPDGQPICEQTRAARKRLHVWRALSLSHSLSVCVCVWGLSVLTLTAALLCVSLGCRFSRGNIACLNIERACGHFWWTDGRMPLCAGLSACLCVCLCLSVCLSVSVSVCVCVVCFASVRVCVVCTHPSWCGFVDPDDEPVDVELVSLVTRLQNLSHDLVLHTSHPHIHPIHPSHHTHDIQHIHTRLSAIPLLYIRVCCGLSSARTFFLGLSCRCRGSGDIPNTPSRTNAMP